MKKFKKFLSGEAVAFLNPIDGNMSEGVLGKYLEIDEDQDDYRVIIRWEGKELDVWEDNVYKLKIE